MSFYVLVILFVLLFLLWSFLCLVFSVFWFFIILRPRLPLFVYFLLLFHVYICTIFSRQLITIIYRRRYHWNVHTFNIQLPNKISVTQGGNIYLQSNPSVSTGCYNYQSYILFVIEGSNIYLPSNTCNRR